MRPRILVIALLLGASAFVFGLLHLFQLRFETGDVYPEYSSLRSDPLGTMALCESLQKLPGLSVERDFSAVNQLPDGRQTAYLHLAARTTDWRALPADLVQEIDGFLTRGGRLVVTFFPETSRPFPPFTPAAAVTPPKKKAAKPSKSPPAKSAKKKIPVPGEEEELVSIKDKWGVEFAFIPLHADRNGIYEPARVSNQTALALPGQLDWHSATVLTNLGSGWETIYARGTNSHPVVAERRFGSGSIVLATDSFFLSNEALRKDRHPELLAWLIGPNRHIYFDEAHFGILETSGVATLVRKYRLHWFVAGLVLLAGLFIWKNSFSLVPPYADEIPDGTVAGREASAGFVNLLRRNIAPRDLLQVCFAEWTKSLTRGSPHLIARVDQAQTIIEEYSAGAQRDPVRAYQDICRALKTPRPQGP